MHRSSDQDSADQDSAPRRGTAAAAVVLVAAASITVSGAVAPGAIWLPWLGDPPGFSPVDAARVQLVWPAAGTTVGLGAWLFAGLRAVLDAVGLGDAVGPARVAGAAIAVLAFGVARRLGAGVLPSTAAVLALSFGGLFWGRLATTQPALLATLFSLGVIAAVCRWQRHRSLALVSLAAASYAVAVAVHPSLLAVLPILLIVTAKAGAAPAGLFACAAILGGAGFYWTIGGGITLGNWLLPHGVGEAAGRLTAVAGTLVAELGLLGVAFLLVGLVRLGSRRDRLVLLAGWPAALIVWSLIWAPPDWRGTLVPALVPLWLAVAVGMTRALQLAGQGAARLVVTGLVVLLPVMNLTAHLDTGASVRAINQMVERYLAELEPTLAPGATMIAEGSVLDRRLVERAAGGWAGGRITRLPQTPDDVLRAFAAGQPVVGFAGARANLEALGVRFEALPSSGLSLTVAELLDAVPDGWIVAVATGPLFPIAVLPRGGPTFGGVGGTLDLFGQTRWHYGIIGVKGRGHRAIERGGTESVDALTRAAEPLTPHMRAPVALRVRSHKDGAAVEYRQRVVASTATGIALAVVSPSGELMGAYDAEFGRDMRILVDPPGLSAALVTGREPCVDVVSGTWTDVSAVARFAFIGGLVEAGQALTLYAGSDGATEPRPVPLRRQTNPRLRWQAFDTDLPADLEALRAELDEDGLREPGRELQRHRHIQRLDVAPPRGRRQLAVGLGGFASTAFARLTTRDAGGRLRLCASVRPRPGWPVSAHAAPDLIAELDFERRDLFLAGWDGPERAGSATFRWTRSPQAEVLLPLERPQPAIVVMEARPAAGAGTTIELRVNDLALPPIVTGRDQGEYRWEVPAEAWRAGMNRLWIGSSRLVRPAESGGSDTRLLGLGVRRLRLVRSPLEME